MKSKQKYWKIECTRHLSTIYETKVNTKHLSESKLKEFIRVLISKYALSDDEILEHYLRIPFQSKNDYINIVRTQSKLGEPLTIEFKTQSADICVYAALSD